MPVDISIKQVDDELAARLRARAKRNHRSLQGELKAILQEATGGARLTVQDIVERNRATGFATPSQAVALVREGREQRTEQIGRILAPSKARRGRRR